MMCAKQAQPIPLPYQVREYAIESGFHAIRIVVQGVAAIAGPTQAMKGSPPVKATTRSRP